MTNKAIESICIYAICEKSKRRREEHRHEGIYTVPCCAVQIQELCHLCSAKRLLMRYVRIAVFYAANRGDRFLSFCASHIYILSVSRKMTKRTRL